MNFKEDNIIKAPSLYKTYKFNISQVKQQKLLIKNRDLNKYLIQSFDNQLFRIIRNITNNNTNNKLDDIIFIDTKGKKDELEDILSKGVLFNKRKYLYYGKNASMSRNGIISLIDEIIFKEVDKYAMMDIEFDRVVLSKFEAYKHLLMSSCHNIEGYVPRIVIIKDYKTMLPNQHIKYVVDVEKEYKDKVTGETKKYIEKTIQEGYKDIEIAPADGAGIHTPEMTEFIYNKLGMKFKPCLFQIRMPFLKGLSIEVDFKSYLSNIGVNEIIDYWGNVIPLSEIDAIWTDNMFKGVKYFKDWDTYLEKFKKYNHAFGISKWNYSDREEPRYIKTNYQCLQTLDLPKQEFLKVADYSKQWVERILSGDLLYLLKFLGTDKDSCKYVKAIRKNHNMIKDPSVQTYIRSLLEGFINDLKLGKTLIHGSYKFLIPDLEGFIQHAGGLKVSGCLKAGEFYSKGLSGEHLIDRNPHITPSEHAVLNAVKNDFTEVYCIRLSNVCMLNYHDITDKRLNGSDKDGDGAIVTDEKLLLSGVHRDLPIVIDIDDKITALEVDYTTENIIKYTLMSLSSDVGEISNCATGYLNKMPTKEKWVNIYKDNVCLLSVINGKEIDYAKTGIKWHIPYVVAKNSKPLPYFLKYKYKRMKKFNTAPSNMNSLAWNIEQWERSLYKINTENMFDILYNEYIPFDKNKFEKVQILYKQFMREYGALKTQDRILKNTSNPNNENMVGDLSVWEIENTKIDFSGLYNEFKEKALGICADQKELANYAVKIVYELHPNRSKVFAWTITEEGLLANLKPNNKIFNIQQTVQREGIEYLGRWYRLEES